MACTHRASGATKSNKYNIDHIVYGTVQEQRFRHADSWKMTKIISKTFSRCLSIIVNICLPNNISNIQLHIRMSTQPITQEMEMRTWKWVGHYIVLRMPTTSLPRVAFRRTPDGHRKRGRPKETWRRTVERKMKEPGWT